MSRKERRRVSYQDFVPFPSERAVEGRVVGGGEAEPVARVHADLLTTPEWYGRGPWFSELKFPEL